MSPSRKAKKGIKNTEPAVRDLTPDEILELQTLHHIASTERFKANQVKSNTALIPNGQKVAEELDAVARLMENFLQQWVAAKTLELGYPQGTAINIDIRKGKVTIK